MTADTAYTPDPRLEGLTGAARRAKYFAIKATDVAQYRDLRRLPTPHAAVIAELKVAQILPAPSVLSADERRGIRNKLKAMRRSRR